MREAHPLDYSEISAVLPHGRAMLLLDRVESIDPGVSIVGIKAITGTEACYQEVPPGAPLDHYAYPVSLLLESFGQTGALLWLRSRDSLDDDPTRVLMFVGARDLRIEGSAFPGDLLRHRARIEKMLDDTVFVAGEIWAEDRRIATIGSMIAVVRPLSGVVDNASKSAPHDTGQSLQDEMLSSSKI